MQLVPGQGGFVNRLPGMTVAGTADWRHTGRMKAFGFWQLDEETDRPGTLESIRKGMAFRGSNVWSLGIAIVLASVGLNVNSPAVIIGAMLVSPLMGPIAAAGVSLGIFDMAMLRQALRNLLVMTLVSLAVSALYFSLSPINAPQPELMARTSPNFFDIIIAFFGGSALMVGSSRKAGNGGAGNLLAGVAIATALMPPLCTAGYGLAMRNPAWFFGAAYLYLINSVFIGLAAFLFTKILRLAGPEEEPASRLASHHWVITILAVLVFVAPSVWMGYDMISGVTFSTRIDAYLKGAMRFPESTVLASRSSRSGPQPFLEITSVGKPLETDMVSHLGRILPEYGLEDLELRIFQSGTSWVTDRSGALRRPEGSSGSGPGAAGASQAGLPGQPAGGGTAAIPVVPENRGTGNGVTVPAASPVAGQDVDPVGRPVTILEQAAVLQDRLAGAAGWADGQDAGDRLAGLGLVAEEARLAFPVLAAFNWGDYPVLSGVRGNGERDKTVFARFVPGTPEPERRRFAAWLRLRLADGRIQVLEY